jgi:hypothetical protein
MNADIRALPLRFPRAITLVPGFTDIGKFPGSSVETGESKLCSDNHLVHVGLARGNVGGNAMRLSAVISSPRNYFKKKISPDSRIRVNDPQGLEAFGQIEPVEFVVPDIDETELIVGCIMIGAFE